MENRTSLIDVFENFLGIIVGSDLSVQCRKLTESQSEELIYEIQKFLHWQNETKPFDKNAILIDLGRDIFLDFYGGEKPILSKDQKRLFLYYPEVLVRWDDVISSFEVMGGDFLVYVSDYVANNVDLIRINALTPFDISLSSSFEDTAFLLSRINSTEEFASYAHKYLPIHDSCTTVQVIETLDAYLFSLYINLFYAKIMDVSPAVIEYNTAYLFKYHLSQNITSEFSRLFGDAQISNILVDIELPNFDKITTCDLVKIRQQEEMFENWRVELGRVLRNTARNGVNLNPHELTQIFRDNLGPLEANAKIIKSKVMKGSLKRFAGNVCQTVGLGLGAVASASPLIQHFGYEANIIPELIKGGSLLGLMIVWRLLFDRPKSKDDLILKFYHMVTDPNV